MTSSAEIRRTFLDFFRDRGHTVVPSSSLVPGNDPTLLFANAGMVQFKDVFTGAEKRSYSRATSAQKCMRVSGKHNDLENVGPSPRHHTFFEMLGNFSFGDYFKREAIAFAWEFLTEVMGLDQDRLYPTIFRDDDEACSLWQEVAGVSAARITRLGKKDNFWAMGDTGPNGPCSEILYDRGPEHCTCGGSDCSPGVECERWWELWNLVFMQYETRADGTTLPLPKPSIDTGLGMERLTAILQGKDDNYETDLFWPIMKRTQELLGHSDAERKRQLVSYRVIADHSRAIAFLIGDGVLPGNEGRNYVLRLILRRAARHGKMLGFEQPFMAQVLQVVMDIMGAHYAELIERRDFILEAATQEEERFLQTLDTGLNLLDRVMGQVMDAGQTVIPGEEAFRLYDTYGFPLDLTRDVAKEQGLQVDEAGFEAEMRAQRERARSAQRFELGEEQELYRGLNLPATSFAGYEDIASRARVLALVTDGNVKTEISAGEGVQVVLDRTPFYAESGGQVGDMGIIEGPRGRVQVQDTGHPLPELTVHYGQVIEGAIATGEEVQARVDEESRLDIARNHTATHLLHRALRKVLGDHARQAGSLVAPARLRFDFTHLQPVSGEELLQVEREVNASIRADMPVDAEVAAFDEARKRGAVALFGEKYGDTVRMVKVGAEYSLELCGGTHLRSTGEIGFFKIVSESGIGSGLRRIEALTGRGAEAHVQQRLDMLSQAAAALQVQPSELVHRLEEISGQLRQLEQQIDQLRREAARQTVTQLVSEVQTVAGLPVLAAQVDADSIDRMREMIDRLREQLGSGVIVLGAVIGQRPNLVAAVTPDLVEKGLHAGKLVNRLAKIVGGGGGGRPTMAQAGGRDAHKLADALKQVMSEVEQQASR
ncbi:MAG: alanine--tRNA ligase [Anaerolineales bacterium]|nr:MAG: alanine--tRNA ligase [Anaerolineales bacterium]